LKRYRREVEREVKKTEGQRSREKKTEAEMLKRVDQRWLPRETARRSERAK